MEKKRRKGSIFSSRGVKFLILTLIITVVVIYLAINVINYTKSAGTYEAFADIQNEEFIYNGKGFIEYSNGYLNYYDLNNRKKDTKTYVGLVSEGLNIACGSGIEVIYTNGSIYFPDVKITIDIEEGLIQSCKCGANYVAALIEGDDGTRIEIYNSVGNKIKEIPIYENLLVNFGFESESSTTFYTEELSTIAEDSVVTITIYDLEKGSKNGLITVYGMLVDEVIFTDDSIFVVGTKNIIRYDRKTNKEVYRVLIYGYSYESVSEVKKGKLAFILTEVDSQNSNYIKLLTLNEGENANATAYVIPLSDDVIYYTSMHGNVLAVGNNTVTILNSSGQIEKTTDFEFDISFAKKVNEDSLIIKVGNTWNIFKAK